MKPSNFVIGETFWCDDLPWRCTDIGTRVIVAIELAHEDDPSWYNGPPYAVVEYVFNESDIQACTIAPVREAREHPPARVAHKTAIEIQAAMENISPAERQDWRRVDALPAPEGMKHSDFEIGATFSFGVRWWRCTDIGRRVITAVTMNHLDDDPPSHPGPPHSGESVFDENSFGGCTAVFLVEEDVLAWLRNKGAMGFQSNLQAVLKDAMTRDE